ncbi:MAG: hypothetical protein ACF8LK_03570 [Phycisphaerales bacterium JB041]
MGSRVIGSLIAVGLLCVGLIVANMNRDDEAIDVHSEVLLALEALPDYNTHGSLYTAWLDQHHEWVFKEHYVIERQGGRRRGRTVTYFDAESYLDQLFQEMAQSAAQAGYDEQADNLKALRDELYFESDQ